MKRSLLILAVLITGVVSAQSPRMCLYEEFTGETCPPCASTNPGLNQLLLSATNATRVIALKWQVPIPTAPSKAWSLYQTNKTEINWRYITYGYGVNSAPTGRMDGQSTTAFGASSDHPVNLNNSVISTANSYTSAFDINVQREWNKTCTAVDLTITINATANFNAVGPLVLRTVMVERVIQFSVQPGSNGEKKFEDVAIKSFPNIQNGTPLAKTWAPGQSQTIVMSCPVPSYVRKKEEIAMVVFIQDDGNRKVAQAARSNTDVVPPTAMAATGAQADLTCDGKINPTVTFGNTGSTAISNVTITPWIDNAPETPFVWNGSLAPGASTTVPLGAVNAATASGTHMFSFEMEIPTLPYNLTANDNKATFVVVKSYQGTPVAEDFTKPGFPPADWANVNRDAGPNWIRTASAGAYNMPPLAAIKYDAYTNANVGDIDELYLPPMDLTGMDAPLLSFDLAYAQRNGNSNDMLEVMVTDDCGATWKTLYQNAGSSLATSINFVSSAYTPPLNVDGHWRSEELRLDGFNKPNVIVKFVVTNGNGNNMYLDNINLWQTNGVGITKHARTEGVNLYPNPSGGMTNISITADRQASGTITVLNTLGQVVMSRNASLYAGSNLVQVDVRDLAVGVYNVVVNTGNSTIVKKLSVNH